MFSKHQCMKKCLSARALALAGMLALPLPSLAYHPLITDDTGTQGMGGNQMELGFDHARSETGGVTEVERAVPFTYTRGVTDALDVFVGIPYTRISSTGTPTESGWGSPAVGLKWRFHENEASSLALKPSIEFDALDDALGGGEPTYTLALILSRETGSGEFHANLELAYNGGEARATQARISVAPVWRLNDQWKWVLDLGLQTNPDPAENRTMGYVGLGVIYSPNEKFDFSLGVIRDVMDGTASTTTATLGLTWRF